MKRFVSFFMLILFSVSLLSSSFAAETAVVVRPAGTKGNTVRMRQKPDGKVLVNIPFDTEVEVLDNQGEWMKISFDGRTGWMKSEFLSVSSPTEVATSFDITGEWYEWYTVDDLATAADRPEPANSRFGVDRFFAEDLLVPSDGRMHNIQLNSHGQYIFDNWTDYEVCVINNDELCILDGYGDDSVQVASLFFVDQDTMWYYGNNEHVAVCKRTEPVNGVLVNSTADDSKIKAIEKILDRKIYAFKNDFPDMYIGIADIHENVVYAEDWDFGRILNEDVFETINWEVYSTEDNMEIIHFTGSLRINGRLDSIEIEFCLLENAAIPVAWSINIDSSEDSSGMSVQDYLDEGMEMLAASFTADAAIAQILSVLYTSSDVHEEKEPAEDNSKKPNPTGDSTNSICGKFYDAVIKTYIAALRDEDFWDHYSEEELNLNAVQDCLSYGGTLQYAVSDINQDGCNELLIANSSEEDFSVVDIYTTNEETAVRLFGERSFGYRDYIDILANGYLYTHGSSGADNTVFEVYSFNNAGFLEKIQSIDYSGDNMAVVEQLRQPYDSIVVDVKNAYSWMELAQIEPDAFTPVETHATLANGILQIPYDKFGIIVADVIDKHYGYDTKYTFKNLHGDNQYHVTGDYGLNGWAHVTGVTADGTITQIQVEQNDWYSHGTSMVEQRIKELLVPVTVFWNNSDLDTKILVDHIYENLTLYYEGTSHDKQIVETDYSYCENGIEVYVTIAEVKYYQAERITISVFSQIPSEKRYYTYRKPNPNR